MKTLTVDQVDVIDELLYVYLEESGKLGLSNIQKVLENVKQSLRRGIGILLVDSVESPESFYWGMFVSNPTLFTEVSELISLAYYGDDEMIRRAAEMKAKVRGCNGIFHNSLKGDLETPDGYEIFEIVKYKKL